MSYKQNAFTCNYCFKEKRNEAALYLHPNICEIRVGRCQQCGHGLSKFWDKIAQWSESDLSQVGDFAVQCVRYFNAYPVPVYFKQANDKPVFDEKEFVLRLSQNVAPFAGCSVDGARGAWKRFCDYLSDKIEPPSSSKRELSDEKTCVYLISSESHLKIGFTTDITKRMASLKTGSATKLRLEAVVKADRAYEKHLHAKFAKYRAEGEWFEKCDEILAEFTHRKERQ